MINVYNKKKVNIKKERLKNGFNEHCKRLDSFPHRNRK